MFLVDNTSDRRYLRIGEIIRFFVKVDPRFLKNIFRSTPAYPVNIG